VVKEAMENSDLRAKRGRKLIDHSRCVTYRLPDANAAAATTDALDSLAYRMYCAAPSVLFLPTCAPFLPLAQTRVVTRAIYTLVLTSGVDCVGSVRQSSTLLVSVHGR